MWPYFYTILFGQHTAPLQQEQLNQETTVLVNFSFLYFPDKKIMIINFRTSHNLKQQLEIDSAFCFIPQLVCIVS